MKIASARIWTRAAWSISDDDNLYASSVSISKDIIAKWT